MRYWVYINNSVLERPFSREELPSIIGFTRETLIFPEVAIAGRPQEWLPARMLLEPQIQQPPVFPHPYYNPMPAPMEQYPAPDASSADPVLIEKLDSLYKELQEIKDKLYSMDSERAPFYAAAPADDLKPAQEVEAYQDTLQNNYEADDASSEQLSEAITVSEDFSEEEIEDIPAEDFSEHNPEDLSSEEQKEDKRDDKNIEEVVEVGQEENDGLEDDNFLQDAIKTTFTKRTKGKKDTKSEDIIIDLAKRDSSESTLTGQKAPEAAPKEDADDDIPSVDVDSEDAAKGDLSPEERDYFAHADQEDAKAKTLHTLEEASAAVAKAEEEISFAAGEAEIPEEEKFDDIPQEVPAAAEVDPEINTDRTAVSERAPVLNLAETEGKPLADFEDSMSILTPEAEQEQSVPEVQPEAEQEQPVSNIQPEAVQEQAAADIQPEPIEEASAAIEDLEPAPVFDEQQQQASLEQEPSYQPHPADIAHPSEQEAEVIIEEDPEAAKSQYDNLNIEKTESIEEKSVLEEFAAEKQDTAEAPQTPSEEPQPAQAEALAESSVQAVPHQPEELSALDELTGRKPLHQDPQMAPQEESIEDQFLKTFTSSIEEVFLDQPTAIISDYVPPEIANPEIYEEDNISPVNMASSGTGPIMDLKAAPSPESEADQVRKVRRIKPAAIKTVPMVAENGVDIQNLGANGGNTESAPNIDEAIAELGGTSYLFKFVKMFSALLALLLIFLLFVALLATMKIIPSSMSPAHALIIKVFGDKEELAKKAKEAAMIDQATLDTVKKAEDAKKEAQAEIIYRAKNYVLPEGRTLLEKIELNHHNQIDEIEWTADQAVDPNYYSIAIKLPPNQEGYSLTYRFSYDQANNTLVPTTSESNNLIQPPARQPSAAEIEAAKTLMPSDLAASNAAPPKVRAPARKR